MDRSIKGAAALALLLALAACGGGGDGGSGTLLEALPPLTGPDRIEPFDPGLLAKAAALQAPPAPLWPDASAAPTVTLPPLPAALAKSSAAAQPGTPEQIGQGREIAETTTDGAVAALLRWQPSPRGTQVAALRLVAQEAHGVRLAVRVQALPTGALLRFYGLDGQVSETTADQLRAIAARNAAGGAGDALARTYWSPILPGEQATLEIEIPADAHAADVRLAVPRLSHLTGAATRQELLAKSSGSCEVNAMCSPAALEQGRSVALVHYVQSASGNAFQCTGTLLNDMKSSGTPYLLTANHCIPDQATASTLVTYWLLRADACGSTTPDPARTRINGGATLLHADAETDHSLMHLNDTPPAGVVYAGSYFGPDAVAGTGISVVHHPEGDLQKISQGTLRGYSVCTASTCSASDRDHGPFLAASWQQGVMEPGSSGAGAFVALGERRYLIGQLFGGTSTCSNPGGSDYFGRFELSYRRTLYQWLNP